jgi:hypothetical protein
MVRGGATKNPGSLELAGFLVLLGVACYILLVVLRGSKKLRNRLRHKGKQISKLDVYRL